MGWFPPTVRKTFSFIISVFTFLLFSVPPTFPHLYTSLNVLLSLFLYKHFPFYLSLSTQLFSISHHLTSFILFIPLSLGILLSLFLSNPSFFFSLSLVFPHFSFLPFSFFLFLPLSYHSHLSFFFNFSPFLYSSKFLLSISLCL